MTADHYASAKARVREAIAEAQASEHPRLTLRQMERAAMDAWAPIVADMERALQGVNAMRQRAGLEPSPVAADALEFANWMVAEIRKARAEADQ